MWRSWRTWRENPTNKKHSSQRSPELHLQTSCWEVEMLRLKWLNLLSSIPPCLCRFSFIQFIFSVRTWTCSCDIEDVFISDSRGFLHVYICFFVARQRTNQTREGLGRRSHGAGGKQVWPACTHRGHQASPGTGPILRDPVHRDLGQNAAGGSTRQTKQVWRGRRRRRELAGTCGGVRGFLGIFEEHPTS